MKKYIKPLFFTPLFYYVLGLLSIFFIASWFWQVNIIVAKVLTAVFGLLVLIDYLFLFVFGKGIVVNRIIADRLSNGDKNKVGLDVVNKNGFTVDLDLKEELPAQFQVRDNEFKLKLKRNESSQINYFLMPLERGIYNFGNVVVMMKSLLGLVMRKITASMEEDIAVYPSFMQMRKFELLAHSAYTPSQGSKRMRKIGHSMEFEQIKEYVPGDDVRTLNWKATARKNSLMVNHYMDERSQQVFCIIDKGRLMKMPFNGLSLLDYAINTTLVLCNVSLSKQDKFGLLTFSHKSDSFLMAEKKPIQLENVLQVLYKQQTNFLESDFGKLYQQVHTFIKQRSLLVLFTNFESLSGMKRQLSYLKQLNKKHLLLVVFFENTELKKLGSENTNNLEGTYIKTIAHKFVFEKRMIVKELAQNGILSILSTPEELTINTVNRYLELKNRQAI